MSHTGEVVEGDRPVNPAAFATSAVHVARPDVMAAAHAHSVYGKAWSALGRPLSPITQDACVFYRDHTVCEAGGRAGWAEPGRRASHLTRILSRSDCPQNENVF